MKSLQSLAIASLLIASASLAHASTTASLAAGSLSSDSFAQSAVQDSASHPADRDTTASHDATDTRNDAGTSRPLPSSNGKVPDSAPADSAPAPSWQSLLPGSIQ